MSHCTLLLKHGLVFHGGYAQVLLFKVAYPSGLVYRVNYDRISSRSYFRTYLFADYDSAYSKFNHFKDLIARI